MARSKGNVNWIKYFDVRNTVLNEYIKEYGDYFFHGVLELIENAYKENIPYLVLIEFVNIDVVCVVAKNDYVMVLQRMLQVCEHLEKYEICGRIVKIQAEIQKGSNFIATPQVTNKRNEISA